MKTVEEILQENNLEVIVSEHTTKTAEQAAKALECFVGQIAKSLIFRTKSGKSILVIAAGNHRVSFAKLKDFVNDDILKPDADYVKEITGLNIGGVTPFGYHTDYKFFDEDLLKFGYVYPSAGDSQSCFEVDSDLLVELSEAKVVDIKE
ncbi:MAG: YbaK/EbsC family protein [Candidatus Dojkabacteria bacterium]